MKNNLLLNNKKGFLIRDFVIVGILFGMIIALFITQVASIQNNYPAANIISPEFESHYSKLSTNLEQLNTANKAVQSPGGLNLIGAFNVAFNSVFTVIAMVWDGVLIYTGMASYISSDFTFFDQTTIFMFLGGAIACITAYLIFIWLSSVTRGKI
jgi:hypothetical protein